ncbi:endonuclease NucS domain-containing protein [Aquibacillus salsiterrae]|uniref:Endonuclease NucS n=1 Tax=Aquibacillus salsiterrae TaxID=2950439 RepID=A0A9X4AHM0_9BACI|nr:endonuclease NucS domain-containing protein [Aquibacillus salsiterrae]MDC3418358.1 endonuclease NucS [Aquibacillus salsiterrae]
MAGYVITFSDFDSLFECATRGVYSTRVKIPKNNLWSIINEQTFADYTTMKEGDNIYLFSKRKIYGIGKLINIGNDCKFKNFPEANKPNPYTYDDIRSETLIGDNVWGEDGKELRWICTFKPSPYFFKNGVDMDTVLMSNPKAFKMLRAFQGLSFIKVDHQEDKALMDIILKRNELNLDGQLTEQLIPFNTTYHNKIQEKVEGNNNYTFNPIDFYNNSAMKNGLFRRETTVEISVLYQLASNDKETSMVFGNWDYLSRQVVASPFKPVNWMDKMDIFGYRYIKGYDTISKYLVMELKREEALVSDVDQLLKYVDWINNEYSFGDYSMIKSLLIASNFSEEAKIHAKNVGSRKYTTGLRGESVSEEWNDISLVTYKYDESREKVEFEIV